MGSTTRRGFVVVLVLIAAMIAALLLLVADVISGAIGLIVVLALGGAFLIGLNSWFHQMRATREAARDLDYKNRRDASHR